VTGPWSQERADADFARAQRQYDNAEPWDEQQTVDPWDDPRLAGNDQDEEYADAGL
jgi:hypothetical protein